MDDEERDCKPNRRIVVIRAIEHSYVVSSILGKSKKQQFHLMIREKRNNNRADCQRTFDVFSLHFLLSANFTHLAHTRWLVSAGNINGVTMKEIDDIISKKDRPSMMRT